VIRTILAVDGTGSMGNILTKVINILKETVERTTDILKSKNATLNVEISLMIYRNYNSSSAEIL
jgi:hypothetical protein